jgi:hypothetical protein
MNGVAQGAEAVRAIVTCIRTLYDSQEFNFAGPVHRTRNSGSCWPGAVPVRDRPGALLDGVLAAVGQLSSISAIHRGEVCDGWRGIGVGSLDRDRVTKGQREGRLG